MGCDDGCKYIVIMEGNKRTTLLWSQTAVFKSTLDEHAVPEALASHMGPIVPYE
jgi:hypothetical protein